MRSLIYLYNIWSIQKNLNGSYFLLYGYRAFVRYLVPKPPDDGQQNGQAKTLCCESSLELAYENISSSEVQNREFGRFDETATISPPNIYAIKGRHYRRCRSNWTALCWSAIPRCMRFFFTHPAHTPPLRKSKNVCEKETLSEITEPLENLRINI